MWVPCCQICWKLANNFLSFWEGAGQMCTAGLHKTHFSGKLAKEQLSSTGALKWSLQSNWRNWRAIWYLNSVCALTRCMRDSRCPQVGSTVADFHLPRTCLEHWSVIWWLHWLFWKWLEILKKKQIKILVSLDCGRAWSGCLRCAGWVVCEITFVYR